jgi:hypothetical protein
MNKRCIVNVATGDFYIKMQDRLISSFWNSVDNIYEITMMGIRPKEGVYKTNKGIDLLYWSDALPAGSRPHSESPYGFKVHAIKAAYEMGYTSVLWLDSPAYAVKEDISPIFDKIEKEGYYVMSHIDPLERFVGDSLLKFYNVKRSELVGLNLPSGSCYGFDITSGKGRMILANMELTEVNGLFRSEVSEDGEFVHRHDEAVLAVYLKEKGWPVFTFDPLFQSDSPECVIRSGGDIMKTDDGNLKIGRYHGE